MALALTAINLPPNARRNKIVIAAKLCGVPLEFKDYDFAMAESQTYLDNAHPMGRSPVLRTDDGYLFESNSLIRHVARLDKSNTFMYGRTSFEASQVDMWLDFALTELECFTMQLLLHGLGFDKITDETKMKNLMENMQHALCQLNRWLEPRTWLVGERMTVADSTIAVTVDTALRYAPSTDAIYKLTHVIRHYNAVYSNPKVIEALKSVGQDGNVAPRGGAAAAGGHVDATAGVAIKDEMCQKFSAFVGTQTLKMVDGAKLTTVLANLPDDFTAYEIKCFLTDDADCDEFLEAYTRFAETPNKDLLKVRSELCGFIADFVESGASEAPVPAAAAGGAAAAGPVINDPMCKKFSAFVGTQTLKMVDGAKLTAVLAALPEDFTAYEIQCFLTDDADCDEFLEAYTRLAETPNKDLLKVRSELCGFIADFVESGASA